MEQSTTAPPVNLLRKLVKVAAAVPYIQKDKKNPHFGYGYASEAAIKDRMQAAFIEQGIVFIPQFCDPEVVAKVTTKQGKEQSVTQVRLIYTFWDSESGESITTQVFGHGIDGEDKGIYKAITGAIKYALSSTFLFATGDDPEADTQHGRDDEPQQTRPQAQVKPAPVAPQQQPVNTNQPPEDALMPQARDEYRKLVAKLGLTDQSIPPITDLPLCIAAMCGAASLQELDGKSLLEKVQNLAKMPVAKAAQFITEQANKNRIATDQPLKVLNTQHVVNIYKKMGEMKLLYRYLDEQFGTHKIDDIEDQEVLSGILGHMDSLKKSDLEAFLNGDIMEEGSEEAA